MATEKILLVDDDPTILDLMNRFLARQGYGIAIANTGQQALAAIQKDNFHLAILDLRLPDYSGLELLSCVKAQSPETEVILFTGHGGSGS